MNRLVVLKDKEGFPLSVCRIIQDKGNSLILEDLKSKEILNSSPKDVDGYEEVQKKLESLNRALFLNSVKKTRKIDLLVKTLQELMAVEIPKCLENSINCSTEDLII